MDDLQSSAVQGLLYMHGIVFPLKNFVLNGKKLLVKNSTWKISEERQPQKSQICSACLHEFYFCKTFRFPLSNLYKLFAYFFLIDMNKRYSSSLM